jgi:hypothetical protein
MARVNPDLPFDDRIDNKRSLVSPSPRPMFDWEIRLGEEVLVVFISRRVQLALVALASTGLAIWLGGAPWGP